MKDKAAFVYDPSMSQHVLREGHPMQPMRLRRRSLTAVRPRKRHPGYVAEAGGRCRLSTQHSPLPADGD